MGKRKVGTGRTRVINILLDEQASHRRFIELTDQILAETDKDTLQDLRDDGRYAAVHKRVEVMMDLPDALLRGHLNKLHGELAEAIADDLSHTAGSNARALIQPLRDEIDSFSTRSRDLLGTLQKAESEGTE